MNNADMPAMPMGQSANGSQFTANDLGNGYAEQCRPAFGLTKREYFAGLAMQGLAPDSQFTGDLKEMAVCAVSWADALLEELEAAK